MNTAKILLICFILLSFAYFVNADDEYKPYLHKASVPEHPKIELYGQYKTNLFPGAATYSYGIEVPKGTNGLTPSLSVSYNSQTVKQRPGVLGTGWLLTQNYIYRDVNATLNDTSDDIYKLVLNNVQYELVYVSGSYHTKIESYMKIENLSTTSNTYYTYWLVTLKDGTTYRLGYNLDSELTSNTGYNYALKWSLDLIEDTHSNKIYYSYLEDPFSSDLGAVYLNEISYNNYEERKVKFIYESSLRQDYRLVYEQGNKLLESRKLQDLNIYAHDNLVRRYNFNYINLNTENSLSSLSEIRLYGSDNVSILHNLSFEYFPDIAGYTKHNSTYIPEELFSYTPTRPDYGVRLVDFNNDGLIDIIKARGAAGQNKSFVNNRLNNWTSVSSFISPVYISVIYNSIETDNGARFADINNDGFVDILYGKETGSNKKAYLNNGSGWSESATWATPVYFVNDRHVSQSVNLVDFNGDGRIDILHANNGITEAHLNTGSGWLNVSSSWQSPVDFISGDNDYAVRIVDLNGDNLPDITLGNWVASLKKAWLNNGSGWSNYTNYAPPVYFITDSATDNGARFTDVNGDGLPDLIVDFLNESNSSKAAYINTGDGWALSSKWQSTTPFTKNGYNIGRRLGDVNGDGFADIVVAQGNSTTSELYTYIKNSSNSYLLKRITNEYGGAIEIDYNSSTYYNNSANGTSTLGFNMRVVDKYNRNNSLNGDFNSFGTYAYSYFGGKYDYKEQEFRGFNIVNETKPDRSYTIHYFHQDDALKGKEYKTEIYDSSGNIFSRSSNGYSFTNRGYYEIFLDSSSQELYDGSSVPEISNVTYGYDSYGNVVYKDNKGDINKNNDEKYEIYEYYYNIDDYILDKVSKYSSYDYDNSTLAKQTRYYYDNGELTKGDLTKVIEWNEGGSDSFTSFDYDSYGNVVKKTNSLGRWTKYLYGLRDTSFTYVDRITNALGHRTDYYYNLGTGNLLWEEKENIRKTYTYDVFGRIKKEILPYDNSDMPTKEYTYTFDGLAPEIIKVSLKEHNGKTVDTYYFYDGFANLVQLKTEIEDDDSVVKNIFYDAQGRVEEEQNPYIENFSPSLSTPDSNVNKTYYTYDILDRVIKVVNPDGTSKTIDFNKWTITDYDENDNKHSYILDAHGRITNVLEYNSNPLVGGYKETYNTSYSYDTNDNLIKITDNEGNEFKFSYDSLGRKIKLEDPDLGTWTYSYDAVGNLVSQNDSVGNVITMSYDVLNRVLNKNSTDVNISFAYDGQYYGTLSNITMSNIGYRYTYDERLRLTKFEKNLYGTWKSKDNSYDSADRIIQKILPRGELEYYYNKQGKVYKINNYITDSDFNAFGSILNRTYNNGKTATFAYDSSNNRLTSISIPSVQNLQYTHDNVGNIMSILDSIQSRNYSMGYDSLSRLINTTINNGLYQYEYDSIGNIKRIVRAGQAKRLIYKGEIPHAPSQVIDSDAGVGAYNAKDIDSGSKNRTVEFFLVRENLTTQNDINWSIDFGDGNIVNSSEKVNVSSPIMVLVQHNYANGGSYDLNISTVYDWNIFEDKFGISAKSLQSLSNNRTLSLIEFIIENDISENATNVQWNCTNGITSSQSFDILGNEDTMVLIEYNYSTSGDKSLNCKAISDDGTGNKTTEFDIKGLEIKNFNLTDLDTNKKKIEFEIYNHYYPLTANWEIKSDGQTFTGSVDLNTSQSSNVTQEITYTTDGDKTANISIYSSSIRDSEEYTFNIKAFEIDRYVREDYNNDTSRIISFVVTNEWPSNLSVSWNLTDPSILNSTYLDQNDTLMVIIQENYTSEGKKEPTVNVYSGTFLTTLNDWFNIYLVEMLDLQTLSESVTSTITELITRSNSGNKTISWQLDTGEENITSDQTISLNQSQAIILIEHNYTTSGVYVTNASINDSSNQDNAQGVAIT